MVRGSRRRYGAGAALLIALAMGGTGCSGEDADARAAAATKAAEATRPFGPNSVKAALTAVAEQVGTSRGDWTMPSTNAAATAPGGNPLSECGMHYVGFGSAEKSVTVDDVAAGAEALEARGWKQAQRPRVRKEKDGRVFHALHVLEKRHWTALVEFRPYEADGEQRGSLELSGMEDDCVDRVEAIPHE
ncbi:hypothetical protein LG634_07815 [Streptomyces bambusae]|uniref:hypothetical protein n=1 Tax=Streptomyces bambusae TaxID=1550616 RepID=UPI001CFECFFB|nr:hypothetical protein [Streptomyces bambusae]MCB5164741.1 hypothetical protein [Streptomyces bambusae]